MKGRRPTPGLTSNPVLIGAVTVLVLVVAVFLAYNANSGLPFVPTYEIHARVPNAAQLVKGNDVRIGGNRVGVVAEITPVREAGTAAADLTLKLEESVEPLPTDSTVLIRPRSALGLKYVEITPGSSQEGFIDGAVMPLANAQPEPVEIDQVFNTFDEATRAAIRTNLKEFGDGFAGRGRDLSATLQDLPPLLRDLIPVMRTLADPDTQLVRLVREMGEAAAIVAPAARTQAALFVNLDTTFRALASVASPYIVESIDESPETLDTLTAELPRQRPFLANTEGLMRELQPGIAALEVAADPLADAFAFGIPTLRRSLALSRRLKPTFAALQRFAEDPNVPVGVRRLTETAALLDPTVRFLEPVQTVCNYMTLWFRNVASLLSEGDSNGTWQRFIIIAPPVGPNSEAIFSSKPADGPTEDNHLHVNPYPNTASPGQERECEAGNETYDSGVTVIGNDPGNQGIETEDTRPTGGRR